MSRYLTGGLPTSSVPAPDPEASVWWDAAAAGTLLVPFCIACNQAFWYPRGFCPRCGSDSIDWRESAGHGQIVSYTVVERAFGAWKDHAPFCVAYVELDEGVTVATNIVEIDRDRLAVDLGVNALFETTGDGNPALRFRP